MKWDFEGCGFPFPSQAELLDALLSVTADRLGLWQAAVELEDGLRRNVVRTTRPAGKRLRRRGSIDSAVHAAEWLERADGAIQRRAHPAPPASEVALPLRYAGRPLGTLQLTWPNGRRPPAESALGEIADRASRLLHRYQTRDWAAETLGAPLLLVGLSPAMQEAEALLEAVAASDLPVLLEAEFGTEAAHFAAMIHAGGRQRSGPFTAIDCADPDGAPPDWLGAAKGGTLFLDGVEALSAALQVGLGRLLRPRLGGWTSSDPAHSARIVASTAIDLRRDAAAGRFDRRLLAGLDLLALRVPPLRERPEDLPPLVAAALARRGFAAEDKGSAAAMALLEAYAWPENLLELERVVARLAVMTGDRPIQETDVLRLAPWISPTRRPAKAAAKPGAVARGPERWVDCVLAGDMGRLSGLHEGLRRALPWLVEHSAEIVTLQRLAREAHVSPSHLTFLFREHLGLTFKGLLARLRIERAKQIFGETPVQRITEVALTVGFSDLSHFERTFRRLVGASPREYRRALDPSGETPAR